jgi:hypothetical protein
MTQPHFIYKAPPHLQNWITTKADEQRLPVDEGPLFIANPDGSGEEEGPPGIEVDLRFRNCEYSAGAVALPVFARSVLAGTTPDQKERPE